MERQLAMITFLLAKVLCSMGKGSVDEIIAEAVEATTPEKKESSNPIKNTADPESVNRLYALYPSKCPVSGRATGKSHKDKEILTRLLREHSEEEISDTIKRYVKDSTEQKSYIKNFSTFLHNLPDYGYKTDAEGQMKAEGEDTGHTIKQPWFKDFVESRKGLYDEL